MASGGLATLSAGEGSWRAAKLWRLLNPRIDLTLLFTDVLYEDADAYRFLIESAANIFDREVSWVPHAEDFPDYRVDVATPIEEYVGNPQWRAFLAQLRERAAESVPELTWLVEGRDPWEVFRDERFLGNSRIDPCSKILKRFMLDRWREENCNPLTTAVVYGIGDHEAHRFDDGKGAGIRPRLAAKGWYCTAPLIEHQESEVPGAMRVLYSPIEDLGLVRPRLYDLGYTHNNCGGFCIKAGHAHYKNRFAAHRSRFFYDMVMEAKLRDYLGADVAMLTDRRGGGKKPLPLSIFRDRLEANPSEEFEVLPGESGCGCMVDEA